MIDSAQTNSSSATGEDREYSFPTPPPSPLAVKVLEQVCLKRGLSIENLIDCELDGLPRQKDFPAIAGAVTLLRRALAGPIVVVGDYDADGVCSTALLLSALKAMGAEQLRYRLPNRFGDGYGFSDQMVEEIFDLKPKLLIAVDHGSNSWQHIERLMAHDISVLVIDHHLTDNIPADWDSLSNFAIVNPHLAGCNWEEKNVCATAMAFFLCAALRNRMVEEGVLANAAENKPGAWLDLVAIATMADQMPMSAVNRILVQQGLARIRAGQCRVGITQLLLQLDFLPKNIHSTQLAFVLAPHLNAPGRLGKPDPAVEFLIAETLTRAHALANEIIEINKRRKDLERKMSFEIDQKLVNIDLPDSVVCLADPNWHIGLSGIVASRVSHQLDRVAFVFAPHPKRPEWVGSGRGSNRGLSALAVVKRWAENQPDYFVAWGGHEQAVGLTLHAKYFDSFIESASEEIDSTPRHATDDSGESIDSFDTDGELDEAQLELKTAQWLSRIVAWGRGLDVPTFDGVFTVLSLRAFRGGHIGMELALPGGVKHLNAIRFNSRSRTPEVGQRIRAVYELTHRRFRRIDELQLLIKYWEILPDG